MRRKRRFSPCSAITSSTSESFDSARNASLSERSTPFSAEGCSAGRTCSPSFGTSEKELSPTQFTRMHPDFNAELGGATVAGSQSLPHFALTNEPGANASCPPLPTRCGVCARGGRGEATAAPEPAPPPPVVRARFGGGGIEELVETSSISDARWRCACSALSLPPTRCSCGCCCCAATLLLLLLLYSPAALNRISSLLLLLLFPLPPNARPCALPCALLLLLLLPLACGPGKLSGRGRFWARTNVSYARAASSSSKYVPSLCFLVSSHH